MPFDVSVAVPMELAPSLKITFPVGTPLPPPEDETRAFNVMDCPKTPGLGPAVIEVAVGILATV